MDIILQLIMITMNAYIQISHLIYKLSGAVGIGTILGLPRSDGLTETHLV